MTEDAIGGADKSAISATNLLCLPIYQLLIENVRVHDKKVTTDRIYKWRTKQRFVGKQLLKPQVEMETNPDPTVCYLKPT